MRLWLVIAFIFLASPLAVYAATFNVPVVTETISGQLHVCLDLTDKDPTYVGLIADNTWYGSYPDESVNVSGGATGWTNGVACHVTVDQLDEGTGTYWIGFEQLSSPFDTYWGQFYWNGSTVIPDNSAVYEDLPKTQFTGGTANATTSAIASSTFVEFDISYFLELSELNSNQINKNPQVVMVTIVQAGNTFSEGRAIPITPWTQGHSTTTMVWGSLLDGQYTGRVTFASADSIVGGVEVFSYTYLYVDFEVDNGTLISQRWDAPYQGDQYDVTQTPTQICSSVQSTPARWGCELITWLFIPSGGFVGAVSTLFDAEKFPWAQQALAVLTIRDEYLQSAGTPGASSLSVTISASSTQGLTPDLEIFNIQNVFNWIPTETQDIIRGIILLGIVFAFLKMIFETINNALSLLSGTPAKSRFDTINGL